MKILMLDRSIGFDPKDREARPLGSRQRGFIALAEALVARGHKVEARRNGGIDLDHNAVAWRQLDSAMPPFGGDPVDRVLVWRDAELLRHPSIPDGVDCWLWFDGLAPELNADKARLALLETGALVIFVHEDQGKAFDGETAKRPVVIAPGACPAFAMASNMHWAFESRDDLAVTVANSKTGIAQIIRIWSAYVAPKAPDAVLEIYAADLFSAMAGETDDVSDELVDMVRENIDKGVRVCRPMPEGDMAERVANARVFLHHGKYGHDQVGQWICDAQAAATPVVSYGGVAKARVENGKTGYIVPDETAYGNLVTQLLSDRQIFASQSEAARSSRREWLDVAGALEKL
ncbi:hypothetical protein TALK_04470 [Thalassospira alkalitolerans]|uniref:Glycosyl transferase family 1 domain-containing protein n=2 Tax=Thalassospira alkalitolerans TaxID=1293890 RepID=A0A1Y2LES7_9PROT|nr:hypothetical protein TALK_04470 [Thalassospira alkalitolerans]